MLYTVSEMAKRLGVAPSTLRYYDKEGLLPFIERSDGGIRKYRQKFCSGNLSTAIATLLWQKHLATERPHA